MHFKRLKIERWQQFGNIDIEFHDRLTILTGANATGKTTILDLLAQHYGWQSISFAVPFKNKLKKIWTWIVNSALKEEEVRIIGELTYSDGSKSKLEKPITSGPTYNIGISNRQPIECFYIPSHRPIFNYRKIENIPIANVPNKQLAFANVANSNKGRYFGNADIPFNYYIKEALISWNIFGAGAGHMEPNEEYLNYFEGFQRVLSKILPNSLGFKKISIKNFEVVLECKLGDFIIDGSSGGLTALIEIAWQIYMFKEGKEEFTVLIDEVENHLHPTMQRKILPDLLSTFPNARFIVSTHNPLIVGSVKDSYNYALRYDKNNKIFSEKLDLVNQAKTATEILDEVLGVSFTMPIWAEEDLEKIIEKYASLKLTETTFKNMRADLKEIGLEKLVPSAITKYLNKKDDKD